MIQTILAWSIFIAGVLLIAATCYGSYLAYRQWHQIPDSPDRWDRRILYYLIRFGLWTGLLNEFNPKEVQGWLKAQEKAKPKDTPEEKELAALQTSFTPEEWARVLSEYSPEQLLRMKREFERIECRDALARALNYKKPRSEGGKA